MQNMQFKIKLQIIQTIFLYLTLTSRHQSFAPRSSFHSPPLRIQILPPSLTSASFPQKRMSRNKSLHKYADCLFAEIHTSISSLDARSKSMWSFDTSFHVDADKF